MIIAGLIPACYTSCSCEIKLYHSSYIQYNTLRLACPPFSRKPVAHANQMVHFQTALITPHSGVFRFETGSRPVCGVMIFIMHAGPTSELPYYDLLGIYTNSLARDNQYTTSGGRRCYKTESRVFLLSPRVQFPVLRDNSSGQLKSG